MSKAFGESRTLRDAAALNSERDLDFALPVGPLPCGP
jgi:hypothetical protein